MTKTDVLRVEDIADILGISKNTIQRKDWREKTGCPLEKKGKRLYALATKFEKWIGN